jgi:threonine dehydrogenase-like Zn-dependent dehydrogenase
MSTAKTLAAVMTSPRRTELRELPIPEVSANAGLLRVAASGICASDWPRYLSENFAPAILGHEAVGYVEEIGEEAKRRWGVKEGDTVAVEEYLPCGVCECCRAGEHRACRETDLSLGGSLRYGAMPLTVPPALYGGNSQHLYLHPRSVLHRVPDGIAPPIAALALALGDGFQWMQLDADAGPGKTVVVFGLNRAAFCCIVAAADAGAANILAVGLKRDERLFPLAMRLGATHTLAADDDDVRARVNAITGGTMADIAVDVSNATAEIINGGVSLLKPGGIMLCASSKKTPVPFDIGRIVNNRIHLVGARGHSFAAVELGLRAMEARRVPLDCIATHCLPLADADRALKLSGGETGEHAIHIAIEPWKNGHALH